MKIAVDVMGGDKAPDVVIDGVAQALKEKAEEDIHYVLVGPEEIIKDLIAKKFSGDFKEKYSIVNATEKIEMNEAPVAAIKKKKDSSISRMLDLAKEGKVDAVVSAGNTGAMMVAATLKLRTLKGVDRPAISAILPRPEGYWVLLDAGANAECKPKNLFQFAIMGEVFARKIIGIDRPKVGLMSIGEETEKGNELTKETLKLLSSVNFDFIGNVEGNDAFTDRVDVIVCDGFVGNVVLKVSESVSKAIKKIIGQEIKSKVWAPIAAPFFKSVFNGVRDRLDHEEYGGAPLLGVGGTCIIAHGNSSPKAIKNALKVAEKFVFQHINDEIIEQISRYKVNNGQ